MAADRAVSTARFVGKRVVSVSAREAIRHPDSVLERAAESNVPVYRGGDGFRANDWREQCREAYRHLMSGISHMLPFVVAGGVLIAFALLFDQLGAPAPVTEYDGHGGPGSLCADLPGAGGLHRLQHRGYARLHAGSGGRISGPAGHHRGPRGKLGVQRLLGAPWWQALRRAYVIRGAEYGGAAYLPQELEQVRTGLLTPAISLLVVGALMVLVVNPASWAISISGSATCWTACRAAAGWPWGPCWGL